MNVYKKQIKRYIELLEAPDEDIVNNLLATQNEDGSFDDIAKIGDGNLYDFRFYYCKRIREIAVAYSKNHNPKLKDAVLKGLKWWTECDFVQTANWYNNIIFLPTQLSDILMCVNDVIEDDLKNKIITKIKNGTNSERRTHDIGANSIWINIIIVHTACLCEDEELLKTATARIDKEVRFADDHDEENLISRGNHWRGYVKLPIKNNVYEGVQRDYSFLEHGPMLHTGLYGEGYFSTVCRYLYESYESEHFNTRCYNFNLDYLLEHFMWTRLGKDGKYKEAGTTGRKVGIYNFDKIAPRAPSPTLLYNVNLLKSLNQDYRKNEVQKLYDNLINDKRTANGVRYFPYGKYLVMQSEKMVSAVRLNSANMVASEAVNWENLMCWHSGDGVLYSYIKGDEYTNVFPTYDWKKLPGVTNTTKELMPLDKVQHTSIQATSSNLCSGISDDDFGIASMEILKDDFSVLKTYVMSNGTVVSMGSGISSKDENITGVQQCALYGDVLIEGKKMTTENTTKDMKDLQMGELKYHFFNEENVSVTKGLIRKNVYDLTYNAKPEKSPTPIYEENEMFIAHINHGEKTNYAYAVYTDKMDYKIIKNDEKIQAVTKGDDIAVTFWQKGELDYNGKTIKADGECTVIIRNGKLSYRHLHENKTEVKVLICNW